MEKIIKPEREDKQLSKLEADLTLALRHPEFPDIDAIRTQMRAMDENAAVKLVYSSFPACNSEG